MYKELKNFTEEQLLEEIKSRKNSKPKIKSIEEINLMDLMLMCEDLINSFEKGLYVNNNIKQYIYEATLKALYGKDIFNWINSKNE